MLYMSVCWAKVRNFKRGKQRGMVHQLCLRNLPITLPLSFKHVRVLGLCRMTASREPQRLAFAVPAHLQPEILVVDEVLTVGDAQFQTNVWKDDGCGCTGRTVLLVRPQYGSSCRLDQPMCPIASRTVCLLCGELYCL